MQIHLKRRVIGPRRRAGVPDVDRPTEAALHESRRGVRVNEIWYGWLAVMEAKLAGLADRMPSRDGVIQTFTPGRFWLLWKLSVTVELVPGNMVCVSCGTDQVIVGLLASGGGAGLGTGAGAGDGDGSGFGLARCTTTKAAARMAAIPAAKISLRMVCVEL